MASESQEKAMEAAAIVVAHLAECITKDDTVAIQATMDGIVTLWDEPAEYRDTVLKSVFVIAAELMNEINNA